MPSEDFISVWYGPKTNVSPDVPQGLARNLFELAPIPKMNVSPDVPQGLTRNLFELAPIPETNVSPDGFEPSTPSLKGTCSTRLSYGPTNFLTPSKTIKNQLAREELPPQSLIS